MASPKAALARVREKRPALDHLIRAFGRYQADAGDRQAAAVTFFGFLSFFPVLALATSVLSFVLGDDAVGTVVREVNNYAPGLADQLGLEDLLKDDAKASAAGALGLLGLLYSGLGWVDALREAIRTIWHHNVKAGNLVVKKLTDVVVLLGLGVTVLLSIAISAATGAFTGFALGLVELDESIVATALAKVVGVALGLLTSTALFLFLFWRLPKVQSPFRRVIKGAFLAAVLFEVLKRVGAIYIERTTENPLYGTFAVIVGLLVWINVVSRMLLFAAAWTVTAPYDSDIEPSGTASAEAAEAAGIPTEFADDDPDDPPNVLEEGAPSPLQAAVQGRTAPQDVPEGTPAQAAAAQSWSSRKKPRTPPAAPEQPAPAPEPVVAPTAEPVRPAGPPRDAELVRRTATVLSGAMGVGLLAVAVYALRTLRSVLRS